MTPTEMYLQDEKKSGLKVGDKVKVLRKAMDGQGGWSNGWIPLMDQVIGEIGEIKEISLFGKGMAIEFDTLSIMTFHYPYFVLEKVEASSHSIPNFPVTFISCDFATSKASTMWNTKCPSCGEDAYQSAFFMFECSNKDCERNMS